MKHLDSFARVAALAVLLSPTLAAAQEIVPHKLISEVGNMGGTTVAESPNGRFLLLTPSNRDTLLVVDKQTKRKWSLPARGYDPVFSPQGDHIAFVLAEQGDEGHVWTLPIDPATARATGAARRVTVKPDVRYPAFSADGKSIAFNRGSKIYTVPATGGEERLLVEEPFPTFRPFFSPDGKWVYYRATEPKEIWIRRAPVVGGASERVLKAAHPLGISPSGKYLAYYHSYIPYQASDATIGFATLDGQEIARGRLPETTYWGRWGSNDRFVFATLDAPAGINRIRLSDGTMSELTSKQSYDADPTYSPDGQRIAVRRNIADDMRLVLLGLDGKLDRVLQTAPLLDRPFLWSPDSRYIAYNTIDRRMAVVEVASGRENILTAHTGTGGGRFAWRGDSKAIRFIQSGEPHFREIREVLLNGEVRTLSHLDSTLIRQTTINFMDDDNMIMLRPGKISVRPLRGGTERVVLDAEHRAQGVGVSPDGKWLSVPMPVAGSGETIGIVPVAGGAPRMLSFTQPCGISARTWHPDGRHLLVSTPTNCGDRFDIYLVPLDGGPARNLTAVDKVAVDTNAFSVSPDGKYVIYDSESAWFSQINEIDVPALARAAR